MRQGFNDGTFLEWCIYNRSDDAFVIVAIATNWKNGSGDKNGGFPSYERSQFHRHCTGTLVKSHRDIAEMMSTEHEKQKAVNRAYLSKVLENVVFLARQGLAFRGNWVPAEKEGEAGAKVNFNFHQLLLLHAKDDPSILWVKKLVSKLIITFKMNF